MAKVHVRYIETNRTWPSGDLHDRSRCLHVVVLDLGRLELCQGTSMEGYKCLSPWSYAYIGAECHAYFVGLCCHVVQFGNEIIVVEFFCMG